MEGKRILIIRDRPTLAFEITYGSRKYKMMTIDQSIETAGEGAEILLSQSSKPRATQGRAYKCWNSSSDSYNCLRIRSILVHM